jgi:hypothetical protein
LKAYKVVSEKWLTTFSSLLAKNSNKTEKCVNVVLPKRELLLGITFWPMEMD